MRLGQLSLSSYSTLFLIIFMMPYKWEGPLWKSKGQNVHIVVQGIMKYNLLINCVSIYIFIIKVNYSGRSVLELWTCLNTCKMERMFSVWSCLDNWFWNLWKSYQLPGFVFNYSSISRIILKKLYCLAYSNSRKIWMAIFKQMEADDYWFKLCYHKMLVHYLTLTCDQKSTWIYV